METKSNSLTAADFFEKLQQDKLDSPLPFSLVGLVKKSEGKEKTIEFAPGGNCSHWVTIPLEYIEDVEVIRTISCKDHSHPLAKLNMKTPKTPEGKLFFAILAGMKSAPETEYSGQGPNGEPTMTTASRGFGGGRVGGGGLNTFGSCRRWEYQCTCTAWDHPGFGIYICIKEDCKFVCTEWNLA
jgi:hypothetical protein